MVHDLIKIDKNTGDKTAKELLNYCINPWKVYLDEAD